MSSDDQTRMFRVQYAVFPTRQAALDAGWPDAQFGSWQVSPASSETRQGWIALTDEEEE